MRIDCFQLMNEGDLVPGEPHMRAVQAFRLKAFGKTDVQENCIRLSGQFFCFRCELFVLPVQPFKALAETDICREVLFEEIQGLVHALGIDHRAACTLITGFGGEGADHGNFGILFEREDLSFILQQNNALFCCRAHLVVLYFAVRSCHRLRFRQCQNHIQQLIDPRIHFALFDGAFLHSFHQLHRRICAGHRHFQVHAGTDAFHIAVASAPVRHHHALVSPFAAENIVQEHLVLIGIGPVETVIAGHDASGLAFRNGNFKVGQIQLTQGSVIHDRIRMHAQHFLTVGGKMLCARRNTVGLDAADITGCQFTCQIGIFGIIFKTASAESGSFGVQARSEEDLDILAARIGTDDGAHLFRQFFAP